MRRVLRVRTAQRLPRPLPDDQVTALLGSLPLFFGLAVVMPILGHSTWHLYRKLVVPLPGRGLPQEPARAPGSVHYAAQFPASLFAGEKRR